MSGPGVDIRTPAASVETGRPGWPDLLLTTLRVLAYCALVLAVQAPEVFGS